MLPAPCPPSNHRELQCNGGMQVHACMGVPTFPDTTGSVVSMGHPEYFPAAVTGSLGPRSSLLPLATSKAQQQNGHESGHCYPPQPCGDHHTGTKQSPHLHPAHPAATPGLGFQATSPRQSPWFSTGSGGVKRNGTALSQSI